MSYKIPSYRIELVRDCWIESRSINSARDAIKALKKFYRSDREIFVAFYLNARNQIIAHHKISVGTVNSTLVHPREVYKIAIIKNACAIIVAHNHPSGGAEPSEADLELTKRLKQAGTLLGIELADSLIVTPDLTFKSII